MRFPDGQRSGLARAVLSGSRDVSDFGTLFYPKRCGGFLNAWYRSYEDASAGLRAAGGYLLARMPPEADR